MGAEGGGGCDLFFAGGARLAYNTHLTGSTNSRDNMAIFIGSREDFHKFIGPFLRNSVQNKTRKHKKKVGKCQGNGCKKTSELQAAHKRNRGRVKIVNDILDAMSKDSGGKNKLRINLSDFKALFENEHKEPCVVFRVLCPKCHMNYDRKKKS